jgi:hypothetical protein
MFLTSEGALLAISLTALVCGTLGTWAVLRWNFFRPKATQPEPRGTSPAGHVRRTIASTTARKA